MLDARLQWDTAGQDRFNKIAKAYYRSADGVVMVFDVTRRVSNFDTVFVVPTSCAGFQMLPS